MIAGDVPLHDAANLFTVPPGALVLGHEDRVDVGRRILLPTVPIAAVSCREPGVL
jgi:hypothetical protein